MVPNVLGVDFSGARDAGDKIWLAEGRSADNSLNISRVYSLSHVGAKSRDEALSELVDRVRNCGYDVVGFDFPFGLPASVIEKDDWATFVEKFDSFVDSGTEGDRPAERFRNECRDRAGEEDRRRATDCCWDAQCPYGVRIRSQTYHGISRVLKPLLCAGVSIRPQRPTSDASPTVVEVYPAATVECELSLDSSGYKGTSQSARDKRIRIVEKLENHYPPVSFENQDAIDGPRLHAVCSDDALDSVLAALSAANALQRDFDADLPESGQLEGHIFV